MRPDLMGIVGPPHVDTANMAIMAMTSAPVQGKSEEKHGNKRDWARTRDLGIRIGLEIVQGLSKASTKVLGRENG